MEFRIADTFTDSLAKLTGDEQKAVKTTAFDLQMNPANPGMKLHKLDRAKDKNFWSVRVSRDIRLIVHKTSSSFMLCYVDHHDAAYRWAERRKLERHPTTGAAQLVEVRETVRKIEVPMYVAEPPPAPAAPSTTCLFTSFEDSDLLGFGVPEEWIPDVREATEDSLLELADHLPAEASEALLELATGGTPAQAVRAGSEADPFEHPDAQRRFRTMASSEELERALEYPWEKWAVFLHPAQKEVVERDYAGPARVSGSAGTGKTVVALHRACHLAREHPDENVLVTTFSIPLAKLLRLKLRRLVGDDPDVFARIAVRSIDEVGLDLYEERFGKATVPTSKMLRTLLESAAKDEPDSKFSLRFLQTEWEDVVDAWQLESWEEYRDVARLGRKTRLGERQRRTLWSIFERVKQELSERGLVTMPMVFAAVGTAVAGDEAQPFDFAVIDEAQDIRVPQLRFLAAVAGEAPNGLFFSGDLGQRIFQTPFSWKSLGVSVRGRSHVLRINYRTSHQIRRNADRLLPSKLADVDGIEESRAGTVSVFNGPDPEISIASSESAEREAVASWLSGLQEEGYKPHEIALFVRSRSQLSRATAAISAAGLQASDPGADIDPPEGQTPAMTMHLAKGLEFRAVAVIACDDEVIPLQDRIESVADDADLADVYETERHLLYVACTRARDHLLVTAVAPASEFLDDLAGDVQR